MNTSHAYTHQSGPAERMSQNTSAASGSMSAAESSVPLTRSAQKVARVVLLKPNFSSMLKVLK